MLVPLTQHVPANETAEHRTLRQVLRSFLFAVMLWSGIVFISLLFLKEIPRT